MTIREKRLNKMHQDEYNDNDGDNDNDRILPWTSFLHPSYVLRRVLQSFIHIKRLKYIVLIKFHDFDLVCLICLSRCYYKVMLPFTPPHTIIGLIQFTTLFETILKSCTKIKKDILLLLYMTNKQQRHECKKKNTTQHNRK